MRRGRDATGSGFFILLLTAAGLAIGVAMGQPSGGFLLGLALGAVVALLRWRQEIR